MSAAEAVGQEGEQLLMGPSPHPIQRQAQEEDQVKEYEVKNNELSLLLIDTNVEIRPPPESDSDQDSNGFLLHQLATTLAARMAVHHFNHRNGSIIDDLPQSTGNCPFSIALLDDENNITTNTPTNVMEFVAKSLSSSRRDVGDVPSPPPNAVVHVAGSGEGGRSTNTLLELSVLATAFEIPLVTTATTSIMDTTTTTNRYPYVNSIIGGQGQALGGVTEDHDNNNLIMVSFLTNYLHHIQRHKYVAVLYYYDFGNESNNNLKRVELLMRQQQKFLPDDDSEVVVHFQIFPYSYHPSNDKKMENNYRAENEEEIILESKQQCLCQCDGSSSSSGNDLEGALKQVKDTGYRTIVWLPSPSISMEEEADKLGSVAEDLRLDQGDHVWVILSSSSDDDGASRNSSDVLSAMLKNNNRNNFLRGALYLVPKEEKKEKKQASSSSPKNLLLAQELGLEEEEDHGDIITSFQATYDAIMSIGLGGCQAIKSDGDDTNNQFTARISGPQLLSGIQNLNFQGASGRTIHFGRNTSYNPMLSSTSRSNPNTVPFEVYNFVRNYDKNSLVLRLAETYDPTAVKTKKWTSIRPYIFANNSSQLPTLLRTPPDPNYITIPVRATGLTMFVLAIFMVVLSALWVATNRGHPIVVAAQPIFLYVICLGCFIFSFSILFSAFDESWGFSQNELDRFCYATQAMEGIGMMLAYNAIFTKLWRANRCLRLERPNIELWRTLWPACILFLATIILIITWPLVGDFGWVRHEIDSMSEDSVGYCDLSDAFDQEWLMFAMFAVFTTPVVLSGIMAWKTLDMDDSYSESKWVLGIILFQFQIMVVSVPITLLLDETSPSARYLGVSIMGFIFTASFIAPLILPKFLQVRSMRLKGAPAAEDVASAIPPSSDLMSPGNNSTFGNNEPNRIGTTPPRIQTVTFD